MKYYELPVDKLEMYVNHVVVLLHADTILDHGEGDEERVLARQLHKRPRLLWVDVACHMRCRCSPGECPLLSNVMYQPFYFNARWLYKQDSLTNAEDALLSEALFNSSDLWNPVKKSCGGNDPILLGTCEFDGNSPIPSSLTLWNAVGEEKNTLVELIFVLYHACSPDSLRYYTLLPPEVTSGTPRPRDFYSELAQYDFTRPHCKNIEQALNELVINQVCMQRSFFLRNRLK